MLVGVSATRIADPPEMERVKSDVSRLPLPPVALNTALLKVTSILVFCEFIVVLIIVGKPNSLLKGVGTLKPKTPSVIPQFVNISVKVVPELTSQDEIFWLKEEAPRNIELMSVTLLTTQDDIFWSKADAS